MKYNKNVGHECPYKNATDDISKGIDEKVKQKSKNTAVQRKFNSLKRKNGVESAFINWYEKLDESTKLKRSKDELRKMFEMAKCDEERMSALLNSDYQRPSTSQLRRNTTQSKTVDKLDG